MCVLLPYTLCNLFCLPTHVLLLHLSVEMRRSLKIKRRRRTSFLFKPFLCPLPVPATSLQPPLVAGTISVYVSICSALLAVIPIYGRSPFSDSLSFLCCFLLDSPLSCPVPLFFSAPPLFFSAPFPGPSEGVGYCSLSLWPRFI